ncbi:bifunctional diguanylate cyclase/phosphodiesterase [Alkalicoccus daliensis]|uniref:Diguanylate cyclase/phosphodiesterase n=1 Tax=Alkalicoccus daliensis TaxID=745820 RepID=A0A1H0FTH2_9BACI|nr:EAL domain-containing protein [Alkalicoccus daliensis]SDN97937.1 diguanylate cyclase/phosphodiesterase [Alkalicoccus daliensis]
MFSLPDSPTVAILDGEYLHWIVILSVIIACCAAYTALSMNQRMQQNSFFHKNFWLMLSSFAMGLGIWSMHFVGMSAFMLPVEMEYNLLLTIVSVAPAILASYLAFYFSNKAHTSYYPIVVAGIIMGLGISSMHYVGMAAMEMEAQYVYRPWIFLSSVLIAIVVSYIALFTFSRLQRYMDNQLIKIVSSILIGLAITSMHYTGMAAVVFYTEEPLAAHMHMHEMDVFVIVSFVSTGIALLLLISVLTSMLDRYVDHRINFVDALTMFPNQRTFEKEIRRGSIDGSLAVIHLHHLEKQHSTHGYEFGDQIIKAAGDIIQSLKPAGAKVYRIEEGRFAILQPREQPQENMITSLERMLMLFTKPLKIGEHHVGIEVAGAVSFAEEKKEGRQLFSEVMAVLQHPSIRYNHELTAYDPAVHTYSFEKQLVQDLSQAMTSGELFLVYQPKVCSKTLQVTGAEALLRWQHAQHGMISPGVFIPVLEESEKIFDVTDWIIEEVCQQLSRWRQEGMQPGPVSINIPGAYITSSRLLRVLKENLIKYKLESRLLELEITETSVIDNIENAITAVNEFRQLGLSVALDDFGTGLSSLSYLKRLPVSTIKIDKSFVDSIPASARDAALLSAIITLCYSLQLPVVIEGVETQEQVSFIKTMIEDPKIQGYYFSRPLPADEFAAWVQEKVKIALVE